MNVETIEANFRCDRVPTADQAARHRTILSEAKSLAITIEGLCPDSREKSLAMTKLEEAAMWASAAIARSKGGDEL